MSLVNDMLRDLEQRGQARSITLGEEPIHSVQGNPEMPGRKSGRYLWWYVIIGVLIGCLAFAWSYWQRQTQVTVSVVSSTPPVPVVVETPVVEKVADPQLRLEQVEWQEQDKGGVLVMTFDQLPQVRLINQTRDSVVISLPNVQLDNALPLPAKEVVRGFNLMQDGEQLILDLEAVREARFELEKSEPRQLAVVVSLSDLPPEREVERITAEVIAPQAPTEDETQVVVSERPEPSGESEDVVVAVAEVSAEMPVKVTPVADVEPRVAAPVRVTTPVKTGLTDAQAVSQARKLLQKNGVSKAQTLLETQVSEVQQAPESRALLASIYMANGNVVQAETAVDIGLESAPAHPGLKKVKARILLDQNDSGGAVALLRKAPPAMKVDAEYHEILAAALQQQGRADDAVNVYYQLLKYNSGQARLWVGLGYSLELAVQPIEARKAYESSLQVPGIEDNLKRYVTQRLSQLAER